MKETLTTSQSAHILLQDENANWSRAGAFALVEYLEELEDDCGTVYEMDRVALRCEFSEHTSLWSWADEHFGGTAPLHIERLRFDKATQSEEIREYIQDRATLIEFEGGIIVSCF